jgi:phosphatidylglycerophosphate synthase
MVFRQRPREAWIVASDAYHVLETVAGLPHRRRLAGELARAGISRIVIVWASEAPVPELADLEVVRDLPAGAPSDGIVIVRAEYVWHRDMPSAAIEAWRTSTAPLAVVDGDEDRAIVVVERGRAHEVAALETVVAPRPYLGFTLRFDARTKRAAEWRLVWSLRKAADGLAAKLINRRISLPITYLLARTRITPNQITLVALACAIAGAFVLSRGGYHAALAGMLLFEIGSIVDGIDGELARLRLQFSRRGQWLDTVVDDISNVCYATGVMLNLELAGVDWARPVWLAAVCAFAMTQLTQYWLIARVYHSGDLAAIPWAFQSSQSLSRTGLRAALPKLLKRDFVVTLFVVLAALGWLETVLAIFAAGAFTFLCVFFIQFARNARTFSMGLTRYGR